MSELARAPVAGPLFATVEFTNESDEPVHTFRVPLSDSTTVRRLAKDALQRLFQSVRSSSNKDAQPCDFFVREIRVGEFKAEIFAQDLVMQVVSVKEEKIFMKVCNKAFASAPETAPAHTAPPAPSNSASNSVIAVQSRSPPLGATLLESERSMDLTTLDHQSNKQQQPHAQAPAMRNSSSHFVRSQSPPRVENAVSYAPSTGTHEGLPKATPAPATHQRCAKDQDNVTPATRVPRVVKSKEKLLPKTSPKKQLREGEQTTPEAARVLDTENLTSRQLSRLIEQKKKEGPLGWGESAHLNFPTNYLSNPDDVKKRLASRPTVTSVANQALGNSSDDEVDDRSGIVFRSLFDNSYASASANVIDVDATSQTPDADRPKGWGADASKFFDPKTWVDDPRKAKFTAEELNEPVRARRRIELPSVRHLM